MTETERAATTPSPSPGLELGGARGGPVVSWWRGLGLAGLLAALAALAAALALAPQASAQTSYGHVGELGGTGTGPGLFSANPMPQRMAVHEESGKVLVADRGNDRIQVFEPTATGADFAFQFGDLATTNQPIGVAVDQDSGDVYVTAAGTTQAIVKFNPDDPADPTAYTEDATFTSPPQGTGMGEIGAFQVGLAANPNGGGIAVDPTTGDILVADPGRNLIQLYDAGGWDGGDGFLGAFDGCSPEILPGVCNGAERPAFASVRDLAVTSTGDVIVADVDGDDARVDRFGLERDAGGEIAEVTLEATLSQANDPVPNTLLGSSSLVVGVNPATDEVLVSSKTGTDPLFDNDPARVYQFADDELVGDFGVANDRFNGWLFGIAVRGADPGRLYVMATQSASPFISPPVPRIQAFDAVLPAEVAIDPPSDLTATEATFTGTVTPQGSQTTWRFEYRPTGAEEWVPVPDPDGDAGDGTDPVPVEATATDLEPNTDYEVRLLASTSGVETISDLETSKTDAAPPLVTTGTATLIADAAATLRGRVNPRNSETTYRFEWGLTTDYGNVVPIPDADVGAGGTGVLVSEPIAGLEPGTTYHFRLVAENEAGTTEGEDRTFATLAAPLPERAYEVVSQVPAGGAPIMRTSNAEAEDGNRVLYTIDTASPHLPGHDLPHIGYLAERGEDGWTTTGADLPRLLASGADTFNSVSVPPDLARTLVRTTASHDPDDQNEDPGDVTIGQDIYLRQPDGELVWITRSLLVEPGTPQTDTPSQASIGEPRMSAMSADGRAFVFHSARRLIEEDPHDTGGGIRLYKWSDGELSLAGVRPDGSVPTGSFATGAVPGTPGPPGAGGGGFNLATFGPNAVSRDGSRVFWRDGSQGYVQIDGEPTVEAPSGAAYGWADPELDRVILIGGDGSLLAFEVDSGIEREITGPAGVRGVVGASEDARRVYFVADSELDSEPSPLGEAPSPEGRNLYLAELDGIDDEVRLRFIAALGPGGVNEDGNIWRHRWPTKTAYASPDGSVLGLGSVESLTGEPTEGTRQLYVYDDAEDSLECASCPADGSPPAGDVNGPVGNNDGWQPGGGIKRWVSSEGAVFFDTTTALVPEDRNGQRDVYEYRKGSLRLVSTGDPQSEPARFSGASRDGATVFFTTADALAPQDTEPGLRKVYAARIGGGFPHPTPPPPCIGDDCQGQSAPPPAVDDPGSGSASGPANLAANRFGFGRAQRNKRRGTAMLAVKVPGPGELELEGNGSLKRSSKRATEAGKVRLKLAPKRRVKRALRRRSRRNGSGRVRVSARVTFSPEGGEPSTKRKRLRLVKKRGANRRQGRRE